MLKLKCVPIICKLSLTHSKSGYLVSSSQGDQRFVNMHEEGYKLGHFLLFIDKKKNLLVGKKIMNDKIKQDIARAHKIMLVLLSEDVIE